MLRVLPVVLTLLALPAWAQGTGVGFGRGDFDRAAPVEVAAETLEVDQVTGRAVLSGDVVIVQGDLRLSAQEVVVNYADADGDRRIERLDAAGDVLIVAGEDAAQGQSATYVLGTSQVLLTGDVVVTQGGATLAGDRLAIDLGTGAGTVSGRVRTTLQP
ncbi:LptA/OstA family protein [Jannaschia sp. LMIT008]|uniref:LptA/OstA family protein n=1 Tax=Jannaschia maritima TaxID=3032585 RepID=UPI002811EF0E|nr:LptA/OstA family protein [Jannaschia sp. LMIT008]